MRQEFAGTGASRGSVLGRARVRLPHALQVVEEQIAGEAIDDELARLHAAIASVREEMRTLRERLHGALAHEVGEFLDLHTLLLDDPELLQGLNELIRIGRYSADYALRLQRDRIAAVFQEMDDAYLRSRVEDIDQVIGRIHAALHRRVGDTRGIAGDILVSDTVAPSELAQLQTQGVMAIVTANGSVLSHTSILARSLHLPLVVGAPNVLQKINDGDTLMIDGASGLVVLEPNAEDLRGHRARVRELKAERKHLHRLRREPTRTLDGVDIRLYANAETREDIASAHALGAAGVGLYRTEYLFLQRRELPDEEEQFHAYRDLVLGMTGRSVTVRTVDLGADKIDHAGLALRDEPNPALGLRGVRLSLAHPRILETQLRALLRASGYGPLRILLPMVASRAEIRAVRAELDRVAGVLRAEGHAITDRIPLGAMIEVPAAAIALSSFIDEVDFLSIGTNDLVQYLLAADRINESLGELYTPLHPAVIRILRDVIRLAHAREVPVSVCGEMAGDAAFAPLLLALGLLEFSLHPGTLLELRRAIRSHDLSELRAAAPALLRARDRDGIERWLHAHTRASAALTETEETGPT
ncbi:phosphoenolpyruvate--protein phosphotransferase [Marilutibacter alkalisoli]|uniref:Phosphoenolpyruvate-protein phosphotransferase n=1 Tax=Marilutibacter alkalisoli TaxID=2591633 RepID=A0A514BPM5_9GAMM|nr:phosphoenolpyruvate--protein phosphotransferase [Lysobacter alkalisoli]QDH69331.1 phosphoenolpyruvate--protein phosphotransferase [Lysobacter alkalisoli]